MSKQAINHKMIGQKFHAYCTGEIVKVTVTEAHIIDKGTINEQVEFNYNHKPIQWGNDAFTKGWNSIYILREDEFRHLFDHIDGKRVTALEVTNGIIRE